jgi:EmrB/QacA subfamily drug resistance transporter
MTIPEGMTENDPAYLVNGCAHRNIIMFIVLIGTAMAVIDGIVVSIALPTITSSFEVGVTQSQWIITAYLVTETSLLLIFGKISEYTGKIKIFLAGVIIFTSGSLACGVSLSLSELILFRIIQAIGSAMIFSLSTAIIFELFPKGEQGRAMGYIGATVAIASIASPVLSGFITDTLGWEYIFLINVPIGVILLLLSLRYFHFRETLSGNLDMDWAGAVTMVIFMVSLILFLGEMSSGISLTPVSVTYLVVFLVSFLTFLVREITHKKPLLELSVFKNRYFSLPVMAMILLFIALFMVNLIGPFYFEGVMGLKPSQVGLVFLIAPFIMVIASPVTGWLYDRFPSRYYSAAGIGLTGISLLLLSSSARSVDLPMIVLSFIPLSVGSALFQSPNNTEIMRSLPTEKTGITSSLSATLRNLAMTLGVSVASIILTFQLHSSGYYGPILQADPPLLAGSIGDILVAGAFLCFAGMVFCLANSSKTEAHQA